MKTTFSRSTCALLSAVAAVACAVAPAAFADTPPGITLPAPVSILNHVEIGPMPQAQKQTVPPYHGQVVNITRLKAPKAATPPPDVRAGDFDPAVYSVYGIVIGDDGVAAIVGPVGGDSQVIHIGDYVGSTNAKLVQIRTNSVVVQVGHGPLHQIGFYGGSAGLEPL